MPENGDRGTCGGRLVKEDPNDCVYTCQNCGCTYSWPGTCTAILTYHVNGNSLHSDDQDTGWSRYDEHGKHRPCSEPQED